MLKKKKIIKVKSSSNQLRVIAGQWRGRKLDFVDGQGLRPTMDRVRETLFNWLQGEIVGARCLDLFTGSGALGFEALSRYAGDVVMIDKNPQAIEMIQKNFQLLGVNNAQLFHMDARDYLLQVAAEGSFLNQAEGSLSNRVEGSLPSETKKLFDIVFLDPPFKQQLIKPFCQLLASANCLSNNAIIYLEMEKQAVLPELPPDWKVVKEKKAGQLLYYLIRRIS
jgi:16S rRNA (guanine966-N2)-methyltransferase